jgi:small subunit ribosomal protein S15
VKAYACWRQIEFLFVSEGEKMARMYSRRKGKAGSHKPATPSVPSWVRYKGKEIEFLIVKLAKEGKSSSQIGIVLRDTYGVPDDKLIAKKSILQILKEKKLTSQIPEDLLALIKRDIALIKHVTANHKDESAKRGVTLTESKIRRLIKHYKATGKLPTGWKYDPKRAGMYTE